MVGPEAKSQQLKDLPEDQNYNSQHPQWAAHSHLYITSTPGDSTPSSSLCRYPHAYVHIHIMHIHISKDKQSFLKTKWNHCCIKPDPCGLQDLEKICRSNTRKELKTSSFLELNGSLWKVILKELQRVERKHKCK